MASPDPMRAALDRLYGVPLEAFVDERRELAKELRRGGDAEAAAEVAKLRKPTAPAWALNQIARLDRVSVEAWVDAAAALRDVSTHPAEAGGDAVRAAMAAHRAATVRLMQAVRDRARPGGRALSEPMLDRVRALLGHAATDPRVAELLREGRVTDESRPAEPRTARAEESAPPAAAGERPRRGAVTGTARPRATARARSHASHDEAMSEADAAARAAREAEATAREAEAAARAARVADLEARSSARREQARRLRADAGRRRRASAAADERLERARRAVIRGEKEAAAAHDAAVEAERLAAAADEEVQRLQAMIRDARGDG